LFHSTGSRVGIGVALREIARLPRDPIRLRDDAAGPARRAFRDVLLASSFGREISGGAASATVLLDAGEIARRYLGGATL
jgi:hypothetical protein